MPLFVLPLTVEESLVTWTDLSNGHIDEGYQERLAAETAQEREARQQHDRDRHSERSVTKKVQVSWSDCLTEFPTVHYLL